MMHTQYLDPLGMNPINQDVWQPAHTPLSRFGVFELRAGMRHFDQSIASCPNTIENFVTALRIICPPVSIDVGQVVICPVTIPDISLSRQARAARSNAAKYLFVWDQFAAIGRIDACLHERHEIRFMLSHAPDGLCSEPGSAAALRLGDLVDEGECLGIEAGGDDGGFGHDGNVYFVYMRFNQSVRAVSAPSRAPATYRW